MATAPLTNPETRIISLAETDLAGLEGLFDEQCREWLALLGWDYSKPSNLIRQIARARELLGFSAVCGEAVIGFAYYVIEGNRCSIGDIYISNAWRGLGLDRQLTAAILDKLGALGRSRRIESQCVSVCNDDANRLFEEIGCHRFDRFYMIAELAPLRDTGYGAPGSHRRSGELRDIRLRDWREGDFSQAARIIYRSYHGEHDSRINSQYRSEEGCAELLSILIDHVWCGDFLPDVSKVALDPATGRQVGVLVASRISPGAGHIGQISILPAYQGAGLGRRMVRAALAEFDSRGFDLVTLAVTSTNTGALHLYETCGFHTIHQFPAFYRERGE